MATNKQINSRLQLKHDIEANWITAGENGFIPLAGEAIIYDKDDTHESSRIKIGDGTTNISELAFVAEEFVNTIIPTVTTSDNGKFLRVVDGAWAASYIPSAEEAEF